MYFSFLVTSSLPQTRQGPSPTNYLGASLLLNQPTQETVPLLRVDFLLYEFDRFLLAVPRCRAWTSSHQLREGEQGNCVLQHVTTSGFTAKVGSFWADSDSDCIYTSFLHIILQILCLLLRVGRAFWYQIQCRTNLGSVVRANV